MLHRNVRVEVIRNVAADAILLDVDRSIRRVKKRLCNWLTFAGYQVRSWLVYRSRRHYHVVIRVSPKPRSLHEVIALQLLLGSDRAREANNLRRALSLPAMPRGARGSANVLYERPQGRR